VGGSSNSKSSGRGLGGVYFNSSGSQQEEEEKTHREEEEAIYRNLFADDDEDDVPRMPVHHRMKDHQQQQQGSKRNLWNHDGEEVSDLSSSFMGPLFRRSSSSTNSPNGSPPAYRARSPPLGSPPKLGSPEVSSSRNLDIDSVSNGISLSASFPGKDGNILLGNMRGGGLTSPVLSRPALSPREAEVEASYVMALRTWLICRGAFDMKSGVLLAQVGAACPKPPELVNRTLRNILEDNPAFSVIPDPSKTTRQVVWLTRSYRGDIPGAALSRFAAANRNASLTASGTLLNK